MERFKNKPLETKLEDFLEIVASLRVVHGHGETHGNTYLKNIAKIVGMIHRNRKALFDFEHAWLPGRNPALRDVMVFTADSYSVLSEAHPDELEGFGLEQLTEILEREHPKARGYNFSGRDVVFFRLRFGVSTDFFRYFEG